jgi:CheY-like chemotaxis protein
MARVAALVPDLLFGSRVQAALQQAGHAVTMLSAAPAGWEGIGEVDVLVVDLTNDAIDGVGAVERLRATGALPGAKTLGFFAHVQPEVRERALQAGFDQVVPRSRMAREAAALVERLAG